jgi:uncharacterized short protein YbdD (DUF466 family)
MKLLPTGLAGILPAAFKRSCAQERPLSPKLLTSRQDAGEPSKERQWLKQARRFLRQLVGIGSYETYCRHMAEKHPEIKPLSQADFVAEAAKRRHDPGRPGRCPC